MCAELDAYSGFESFVQSGQDPDPDPMPIVLIDQDSDPNATVVQLSFGDRLGALIDTVSGHLLQYFRENLLVPKTCI